MKFIEGDPIYVAETPPWLIPAEPQPQRIRRSHRLLAAASASLLAGVGVVCAATTKPFVVPPSRSVDCFSTSLSETSFDTEAVSVEWLEHGPAPRLAMYDYYDGRDSQEIIVSKPAKPIDIKLLPQFRLHGRATISVSLYDATGVATCPAQYPVFQP